MGPIEFTNAYYVKLGQRGLWEESSIREGIVRIGWTALTLDDINNRRWDSIKLQLEQIIGHKGAATRDFNALRLIVESTPADIWITFYRSRLWWCRLGEPVVLKDDVSKYREVAGEWSSCSNNGRRLLINEISGRLSKVQGFRGTACRVKAIDDLRRLLNDHPSEAHKAIWNARASLAATVEEGLKLLHWKDFETLVDLIFRGAGWRRVSLVGETMKYADMELEEPVTGELYQVQVKSSASVADFADYASRFTGSDFRRLYFVVHSPKGSWPPDLTDSEGNVEAILPGRLAQMVLDFGLVNWLLKKTR